MSTSPLSKLQQLIDSGAAQEVVQDAPGAGLSIACLCGGRRYIFNRGAKETLSEDSRVDIGCLMKNITALVFARAVAEGRLNYGDEVGRYFPEFPQIDKSLLLEHLLSHSHGLDGSMFDAAPVSHGFIDIATIWTEISGVPAISRPGAMFYYWGNVGLWIAGAVVERIYGCTYAEILQRNLCEHWNICERLIMSSTICPASGGISLSSSELLRLCDLHLDHLRNGCSRNSIRRLGEARDKPILGWPQVAEHVGMGWFHYIGSTLGSAGVSAEILVSPPDNAAIAIAGDSVHDARRRLFGALVDPEFNEKNGRKRPRLMTRSERSEANLLRFAGTYGKASHILEVCATENGELRAQVFRALPGGGREASPLIERPLLPALDDTFYPAQVEPKVIPFLKFEVPAGGGPIEHVISGTHIFRKVLS